MKRGKQESILQSTIFYRKYYQNANAGRVLVSTGKERQIPINTESRNLLLGLVTWLR
jgi:hypothetical protein